MAEYIVGIADDSAQDIDRLHREYAVNGRIVRCKDCRFRDDPNSVISEWLPCQFGETPDNWYCASGRRKKQKAVTGLDAERMRKAMAKMVDTVAVS